MNRAVWAVILIGFLLVVSGLTAAAGTQDDALHQQLDALPGDIDDILSRVDRSFRDAVPDLSLRDVVGRIVRREPPVDPALIGQGIASHLARELIAGSRLAAQLLAVALVLGILRTLPTPGGDSPVTIARLVCVMALAGAAAGAFTVGMVTAAGICRDLVSTMLALLPVLTGLVAASGAYATAGLFHPFMIGVVHYSGTLAVDFVLPLIMTAGVIELVGQVVPGQRLSGLAGLLRQIGLGVLGLGFCLVLGMSAVLGAAAMASDGVALRSLKFAAGAFIPVIGKMFGDAAELVLSSSLLLKNAVGVFGAVCLVLVAAAPLTKLLALILMFRLVAAIGQPLGVDELGGCVSAVAASITQFAITAGAVTVMFFLTLTALIAAGNAAMMLR